MLDVQPWRLDVVYMIRYRVVSKGWFHLEPHDQKIDKCHSPVAAPS
jgi:hypothetical protein